MNFMLRYNKKKLLLLKSLFVRTLFLLSCVLGVYSGHKLTNKFQLILALSNDSVFVNYYSIAIIGLALSVCVHYRFSFLKSIFLSCLTVILFLLPIYGIYKGKQEHYNKNASIRALEKESYLNKLESKCGNGRYKKNSLCPVHANYIGCKKAPQAPPQDLGQIAYSCEQEAENDLFIEKRRHGLFQPDYEKYTNNARTNIINSIYLLLLSILILLISKMHRWLKA